MGTGIDGGIDGGGAGSGGGGAPVFPVFALQTTAEAIRDRAIVVIAAVTPRSYGAAVGNRFRAYRNEGDGDFIEWAKTQPADAFRRFQVRTRDDTPPEVSNTDFEERKVQLVITIAYPQNARTGKAQALDRDDIIDEDFKKLDFAIGLYGRANFSPPNADAMPLGATRTIVPAGAVDFLVITEEFTYQRRTS